MGNAFQRNDSKDYILTISHWRGRDSIRLAFTRKCAKISSGLDPKMKLFLVGTAIICFSFSAFSGANLHTLIEIQQAQYGQLVAAKYTVMSMQELTEIRI